MSAFQFPHKNTYPKIAYKLLDIKRDNIVLEVGCAEGYFSRLLSKEAGSVIRGYDGSEDDYSSAKV